MCSGGSSPKGKVADLPDPIPPPDYADYSKKRKGKKTRSPGAHPNILTSPLGVAGQANVAKPTLLGS